METIRFAALADLHVSGRSHEGVLSHSDLTAVVTSIGNMKPDAVFLCGDLTHNGSLASAEVIARELQELTDADIPVLGVFGNHDYRANNMPQKKAIYADAGIIMLDGTVYQLNKQTRNCSTKFGIMGITGGYDGSLAKDTRRPVHVNKKPKGPHTNIDSEINKLTACLESEDLPDNNAAIMHFAPSTTTLNGTLLYRDTAGSIRFEDTIRQFTRKLSVVFHGHTHNARRIGKIANTDVVCASMQIGVREAREKKKDPSNPKNFYTVYETRI